MSSALPIELHTEMPVRSISYLRHQVPFLFSRDTSRLGTNLATRASVFVRNEVSQSYVTYILFLLPGKQAIRETPLSWLWALTPTLYSVSIHLSEVSLIYVTRISFLLGGKQAVKVQYCSTTELLTPKSKVGFEPTTNCFCNEVSLTYVTTSRDAWIMTLQGLFFLLPDRC